VPNFVEISQAVAETSQFFKKIFKMAVATILDLLDVYLNHPQ